MSFTRQRKDLAISIGVSLLALMLAAFFDANERFIAWAEQYEHLELDELPMAASIFAAALAWFAWRRWRETVEAQAVLQEKLSTIAKLQQAQYKSTERAIEKSNQLALVGEMTEAMLVAVSVEESLSIFQAYISEITKQRQGSCMLVENGTAHAITKQWHQAGDIIQAIDFSECWSHRSNKFYDSKMAFCSRSCNKGKFRQLCFPVSTGNHSHGVVTITAEDEEATELISQSVTPATSILAITLSNLDLRHDLFRQAIKDPLTGLLNRRGWQQESQQLMKNNKYLDMPFAVITIDIDNFKQINDNLGHEAGDKVLKTAASVIIENTRQGDTSCRLGGDELVVLLSNLSLEQAVARANSINLQFQQACAANFSNQSLSFSLSAGVACFPSDGDTIEQLIARSDACLYQAKQAGRNRTMPLVKA